MESHTLVREATKLDLTVKGVKSIHSGVFFSKEVLVLAARFCICACDVVFKEGCRDALTNEYRNMSVCLSVCLTIFNIEDVFAVQSLTNSSTCPKNIFHCF